MFSSKHGYPDVFLVLDQLEAVFSSKHGYPDVFLVLDQLEAVSRTKHGYPDVSLIVLDQLEAVFSSKHGGPDVFLPCPAAQMALLPRGMEGEGGVGQTKPLRNPCQDDPTQRHRRRVPGVSLTLSDGS